MATPSLQIQISEPEYKLLQTLVYQECGMYFDERRAHFLQDRLQRRLKVCGWIHFTLTIACSPATRVRRK